MKDFRELPATVSSQIEGWRMEAILRTHSKITLNDILSRMVCKPEQNIPFVSPSCLSMRMDRWRKICRCIQWNHQGKDDGLKQYILGLMTTEMKQENTTEGLKDIVQGSGEREKIELINFGSKPGMKKAEIPDTLRKYEKTRLQQKAELWDRSQVVPKKAAPRDRTQVGTQVRRTSTHQDEHGAGDAHGVANATRSKESARVLQNGGVRSTGSQATSEPQIKTESKPTEEVDPGCQSTGGSRHQAPRSGI